VVEEEKLEVVKEEMVVLVVVTLLQIQIVEEQETHLLQIHPKVILELLHQDHPLNQVKVVEVLLLRLLMAQKLEEMVHRIQY
tara:strand:- start:403 stop:648 length:246 start_codon:yes stop_codon:yes gene_type:complete